MCSGLSVSLLWAAAAKPRHRNSCPRTPLHITTTHLSAMVAALNLMKESPYTATSPYWDFRSHILAPLGVILLLFDRPVTACIICPLLVAFWNYDKLNLKHFLNSFFRAVAYIFFRQIEYRNAATVPTTGACIFVCAPHANQFLDPILVQQGVNRTINFVAAAKSIRDPKVGPYIRIMEPIGVERPMDLAKTCTGKIVSCNEQGLVTGSKTCFLSELAGAIKPDKGSVTKQSITGICFPPSGVIWKIKKILSDTELLLMEDLEGAKEAAGIVDEKKENDNEEKQGTATIPPFPLLKEVEGGYKFNAVPAVDQSEVFKEAWAKLAEGGCVGIFPEGGSHDRTNLLPLKAGVAIMAIGAMANNPGLDVKIIPVGLNYFHGHRFRSRVYLEYLPVISITAEQVAAYKAGGPSKHEVCNNLLGSIKSSIVAGTVEAPDYKTLQLFWAVRRLYVPSNSRLQFNTYTKLEITRRLRMGYEQFKDMPEIQDLKERVELYNSTLRAYGMKDHQVKVTSLNRLTCLLRLAWRLFLLICFILVAIPGFFLNVPVVVISRVISHHKAKEALAKSSVKIAGRDVLATWKILTAMSMLPLWIVVYPSIAAYVGYALGFSVFKSWLYFTILQPFICYGSVRFVETSFDLVHSLTPLFLGIIFPTRSEALREERETLKTRVREIVDQCGPKLYGSEEAFLSKKMIKPNMFL